MFLASLVHRHAALVALAFLDCRHHHVTFIFPSDNQESKSELSNEYLQIM